MEIVNNDIMRRLWECRLCPRSCGVDRRVKRGWCGGGMEPRLALVSLHPWEEPVIAGEAPEASSRDNIDGVNTAGFKENNVNIKNDIEDLASADVNTDEVKTEKASGMVYNQSMDNNEVGKANKDSPVYNTYGAGTVFFSGCNLRCIYCQNHEISHEGKGIDISIGRLAEIFLEQQARGARTLDLVTPTHYVPQIIVALDIAKAKGLRLPVVYNSSGYDSVETVKMLEGYVDVFLPDVKYYSSEASRLYSAAPDYFEKAQAAIAAMVEIAGEPVVKNGIMQKGVLVRHMVLPGLRKDSMRLLDWLWQAFGDRVYLSIMNQYTPLYRALSEPKYKKLARRVTSFEYDSVVDYAYELGFRNCFVQERRAASKEYVPDWSGNGVLES